MKPFIFRCILTVQAVALVELCLEWRSLYVEDTSSTLNVLQTAQLTQPVAPTEIQTFEPPLDLSPVQGNVVGFRQLIPSDPNRSIEPCKHCRVE